MFFKKKSQPKDILEQKKEALTSYADEYGFAVALVSDTIERISELSADNGRAIQEIDDYQKSLEEIKANFAAEKKKNDRIIQNFRTLLATD